MRVYIEVTEAQHAQLKEMAGLVPVSRWIRSQLFPVDDAQRAKELIPLLRKSIAKSKEVANGKAKLREHGDIKICVHGMPEGHNCWQCGGIAQV